MINVVKFKYNNNLVNLGAEDARRIYFLLFKNKIEANKVCEQLEKEVFLVGWHHEIFNQAKNGENKLLEGLKLAAF